MNQACDQTSFSNHASPAVDESIDRIIHGAGPRGGTHVPTNQWRGLGYLLGIAGTITVGTIFVVLGIESGATGWTAIAFAAGFPLAAMFWTLALTLLRTESGHRPVPGARTGPDNHQSRD